MVGTIFEDDFADICTRKVLLMSMRGRLEALVFANLGERKPNDMSENLDKRTCTRKEDINMHIFY